MESVSPSRAGSDMHAAWRSEGEAAIMAQALADQSLPLTSVLLGDWTFGGAQLVRAYGERGGWLLTPKQLLAREWLNEPPLSDVNWNTQISGINIPEDVAEVLEERWLNFLEKRRRCGADVDFAHMSPDEVADAGEYWEGAVQLISVDRYERDPEARRKCLEHYGLDYYVCEFNFERIYGLGGRSLIHVHHLKPLSEIGWKYRLDPVKDLRPVCPNCHAMIHRRSPPYSIEEMIELLHGVS